MGIGKKFQSGQALVLVLLSLAVVLTLVLYILSRSITDVAISSREEEAVRAFSAAEAGVERALVIGVGSGTIQLGDASFSSNVTSFAEASRSFVYPSSLASGDSITTWFSLRDNSGPTSCDISHPCFSGNKMKVCWGRAGTGSSSSTTPAVEVSFVYLVTPGNFATARIARATFDPNAGRRASNFFSAPDAGGCTINGESFAFQKDITFADLGITSAGTDGGLQFARIRMFYNTDQNHDVGVDVNFSGNDTLPSQGLLIDSTGSAGESNRKVEVFQAWPEAPEIFDFSVFSSGGVNK